jgi:hypothetical protein
MTQAVALAQQASTGVSPGFRNRIINGGMTIDQRNAGASVTQTTSEGYSLDRFLSYGNIASKFTMQQSSTAPAGFVNSVVITSSAATVVGSSDQYYFVQKIEGYNTADLGWGTANAKTVTLSFWARASVIGTYSVFLLNNGSAYSYVANYTISVADTFEYKTITIVAPTVGTWLTTNGLGIYVGWDLGSGSTYNQTAGSWQAGNKRATSGSTQLVATSGATLYLTGVQLEVGSTATSFDYRPYGTELQLCQRYYIRYVNGTSQFFGNGDRYSSTFIQCCLSLQTEMRIAPSLVASTGSGYYIFAQSGTLHTFNSLTIDGATTSKMAIINNSGDTSDTAGEAGTYKSNNASSSIAFNAEL